MSGLASVGAAPFTYAAHVLAVAAAVMVLVWTYQFRGGMAFSSDTNKNLIFNIHPVFMLIGFIILGSEAILSYKVLPWSKDVKKVIHLILHGIAAVLGCIGIYAAFKNHNEIGAPNMYSWHSWIGIITISIYGIQWIYSFITFYFPGGSPTLRRILLPWHVLLGIFVYVLAVLTAELGFLEKLTFLESAGVNKYGAEANLVNFTALVLLLLGTTVVISAVAPARSDDSNSYSALGES